MNTSLLFVSLWALASAIAVASCESEAAEPPAGGPPALEVGVDPVTARAIHPAAELTGRVEAIEAVQIRPRVSGHIEAVRYVEGAQVAAGDVLFVIDPRPYRAVLARANAELARAKARLELARAEAARAEQLLEARAIARAERDVAASTAVQAQAEVAAAAAAVQLAALDVELTTVRSPIAGRAGQALATRGDYAAAGPSPTELTTVVSLDPVHVYFDGDERLGARYAAAAAAKSATRTPVRAQVGLAHESGFPHEGTLDFVDHHADPATGTVRLRALVPNPAHALLPGLHARVRLSEAATVDALLIDEAAILTDQDRKYVYAIGPGDTAVRRDVKLGELVEGRRRVLDGLKSGDRVIVGGLQKIGPGAPVIAKPRSAR